MQNWKKILKTLGFNESESTVYLTALQSGPAAVQDLAKTSGVSRVTTYVAIEALTKLGLMSSAQKGKKLQYQAESPERLSSFLSGRIKEMETTLAEVRDSINELKLLQRGEKPVVKMLEGKEGIKALQDDIINSRPKEMYELFNSDSVAKIFTDEELKPFRDKLQKMNINGKSLAAGSLHVNRRPASERHEFTTPEKFTGDIIIYNNKVALTAFEGKIISVIVESKEIAETAKALFLAGWQHYK